MYTGCFRIHDRNNECRSGIPKKDFFLLKRNRNLVLKFYVNQKLNITICLKAQK